MGYRKYKSDIESNRAEFELIATLRLMVKDFNAKLIKKRITYYSLLKFCKKKGLRLKAKEVFNRVMNSKKSSFVKKYNTKVEQRKRFR